MTHDDFIAAAEAELVKRGVPVGASVREAIEAIYELARREIGFQGRQIKPSETTAFDALWPHPLDP